MQVCTTSVISNPSTKYQIKTQPEKRLEIKYQIRKLRVAVKKSRGLAG